jgi:osmoprotectant transport system ATP-binding protein
MIRLDGVSKKYEDGTVAVHDLDLDVPEGETVPRAAASRRP